ncbi:MAG TPA: hypothetical protein ENN69_02260 [Spirochaetia bacterium]|nr:hypothetical protein [Spirochaetia bacterium]
MWGNYRLFDILYAGLADADDAGIDLFFFAPPDFQDPLKAALSAWQLDADRRVRLLPATAGEWRSWLLQTDYDRLLVARSGDTPLFESRAVLNMFEQKSPAACRLAVGESRVDFYLLPVKKLLGLLLDGKKHRPDDEWISDLFNRCLPSAISAHRTLPGRLLLTGSPVEIVREHRRFLTGQDMADYPTAFERLRTRRPAEKEAYIGERGRVSESFIGAGAEIHGKVRNSVIFRDVFVEQDAEVVDSVVMSGNRIAREARITNALIFPFLQSRPTLTCNIETRAAVGGTAKKQKNRDYPRLIFDSLTVVGANVEIPADARIEEASFIAPDLPKNKLTRYTKVPRGMSVVA